MAQQDDELQAAISLYSASTELCADVIASHPKHAGLFALGTYQVTQQEAENGEKDESPAYTRRGRVTLHQLEGSDDQLTCRTVDSHDCPAVLDMAWSTDSSGSTTLVAALADGRIALHELNDTASGSSRLSHEPRHLRINNRSNLCLSLDVAGDASLLVSQSDGSLAYIPAAGSAAQAVPPEDDDDDDEADEETIAAHAKLNVRSSDSPPGQETWQAHGYEAWCVAFARSSPSPNVAWSGGDDLQLKGWDLRMPNGSAGRKSTFVNKRSFEGGVTAMQNNVFRQHLWAVGSYDGKLRLIDERNPLRPLSTVEVGGGVWRVKWHPTDASKLLLGTMHDGFKILNVEEGTEASVVRRFDEHKSLAYGCDWDRAEPDDLGSRVQSCSFYDQLLHVWRG